MGRLRDNLDRPFFIWLSSCELETGICLQILP